MQEQPLNKYENLIRFILTEKFLTITVLGSIFTFQFAGFIKLYLFDPILDWALPDKKFNFMDITIKEGQVPPPPEKTLVLRLGDFFREFIKYCILMLFLFLLSKYTSFPDTQEGNISGSALM